jgi:hypothetical protein
MPSHINPVVPISSAILNTIVYPPKSLLSYSNDERIPFELFVESKTTWELGWETRRSLYTGQRSIFLMYPNSKAAHSEAALVMY